MSKKAPKTSIGWYLLFGGLVLFSLGFGVVDFFRERAFLAHAELDNGTITAYELHVRNDGLSEYCPRIEFTSKAGEPVAVQGNTCPSAPDESQIRHRVQVYYDPQHPEDYQVKDAFTGFDGLILGLLGAAFFGLFVLVPLARTLIERSRPKTATLSPLMQQDAARYRANQLAAERKQRQTPADDEAELARLRQQEAELQKKIDERRQDK